MDLFQLSLAKSLAITVRIDSVVTIVILGILAVAIVVRIATKKTSQKLEIDEAELGIGSQKIKFKANTTDMQVAYSLWIEMSTRTIGVAVDKEHDLVHEVYKSWYEFFGVCRSLLKNIPITKYKHRETVKIVEIAIAVLNSEIRPHLTKWQARYQRWYTAESTKEQNAYVDPHQIQRHFPQYDELMSELCDVNEKLINYRGMLQKLLP